MCIRDSQRDFMPEDTKAGMIQAYLDKYTGSMVCSKQLYKEEMCIRDREGCDFPQSWSAPNHTGDATLPLRWLSPATLSVSYTHLS